jgi:hypothetical protein
VSIPLDDPIAEAAALPLRDTAYPARIGKLAALVAALSGACVPLAQAAGRDEPMLRVFSCKGDGAAMELYLPQAFALSDIANMPPTYGYYALDLTEALKGKPLERVRVSISRDKKFVIVDQYSRGLPPTRIPIEGGTVDFDQRFGTQAKCRAFNTRE